jgi:hypothetical protein
LIPINDPAAALAEPAAIVCALDKAERPRRREAVRTERPLASPEEAAKIDDVLCR